ncbi:VanZ family protein [bacterium]|nr:VanZ family protein [bacterium]
MPTNVMGGDAWFRERATTQVRESLGPALAIYMTAVILLVTLAPFELQWPPMYRFTWPTRWNRDLVLDLVANVLLFIPVGFFYRLCLDRSSRSWRSLMWSAFLTLGIEFIQTMIPPRVASPLDVATNLLGALIGILCFSATVHVLRYRQVQTLLLELPLAGVFYLLVPILWLNALLEPTAPHRVWLTIPLGLMGGLLLGSISHHRLGLPGSLRPTGVVVVVGIWILLANAPSLVGKPQLPLSRVVAATLLTLVLVYLMQVAPAWSFGSSRRFETATLRRMIPLLLLYLLLDAVLPWEGLSPPWRWRLGFDDLQVASGPRPLAGLFAIIEHLTSHVVLGFVLAGLRNRIPESLGSMLVKVTMLAVFWIAATETLRGFHPRFHFSIAHFALGLGAAILGAYMYRMHQKTVWRILGRMPMGESPGSMRIETEPRRSF